ncbi:MAG: SDR family oxidoreductase [Candidatus Zixiibacteriota bacterium]
MERCLITGASGGIGRAVALRLALKQRLLLLHGRDRARLGETAAQVASQGGQSRQLVGDLADTAAVERVIADIGHEPLQMLVHSAGIAIVKPMDEHSVEEWQQVLAVNVTAPFLLTQKLLPLMPPGASVVNILSVAAKVPFAGWSSYCMSKFALDGFMRSVREEVRSRGIRVINIYPQATATAIWNGVPGDWPRERMMAPEQVAEAVAFALSRPADLLVEDISLGNLGGNL